MQMSQLDITVVDEIEELQGQSLSSNVENRGNIPVAIKLSKTDQFKKNTALYIYSKTGTCFLGRYCGFLFIKLTDILYDQCANV